MSVPNKTSMLSYKKSHSAYYDFLSAKNKLPSLKIQFYAPFDSLPTHTKTWKVVLIYLSMTVEFQEFQI